MTTPKKRTKPPFKPTDAERTSVEIMAAIGTTQIDIARCIRGGIDVKTLTKYFREEIDTAGIKARSIGLAVVLTGKKLTCRNTQVK